MTPENDSEGLFLSKREAQLMWHLIKGESLEMIAERHRLALSTVHFYLQSLYMKLADYDISQHIEESEQFDMGEAE